MPRPQTTRRIALALAAVVGVVWLALWWLGHIPRTIAFVQDIQGEAFGSNYSVRITYPASEKNAGVSNLNLHIDAIVLETQRLMSSDVAESEVARFNAQESTDPFRVSADTAAVLACAFEVHSQTAEAFDISLGPLARTGAALSDTELGALRPQVGMDKLEFDPAGTLRKRDPAVTINVDALLPGLALDRIVNLLEAENLQNFHVELGRRSYQVIGDRNEIETPFGDILPLKIAVVTVSSSATPLIDGRTGRPAADRIAEVTVMHESALWAEAYARAILVLGPDDGLLLAKLLELPVRLTTRGEAPVERASAAYLERFGTLAPQ